MTKAAELRKLSDAELRQKIEDLSAELLKLRFQKATMQLANPARIRQVRREIARCKTILNERRLARERGDGE